MRSMRLRRAALLVLAALAVAGCGDSVMLSPDPSSIGSGAYTLTQVNATALPFDVRNDATGRVTITQGSLTVGDGTFQQSLTLEETPANGVTGVRQSATQGTVTVTGDHIVFKTSDGGMWEGTASGARIDYTVPGNNGSFAFTFRR